MSNEQVARSARRGTVSGPFALWRRCSAVTNVDFSFHRILDAGLGFEVEVSMDLSTWIPFTKYYRYQDPPAGSDLRADYDRMILEPIGSLPSDLFYRIKIQAGNAP